MKRTRAQNTKLQDPQDPSSAALATTTPNPKPQRKAKQPRQPKAAATGGKKASAAAAAREVAAAAATASHSPASVDVEMAPVVPDVCGGGGGADPAGGLPADWDEMDGANVSPWWTFGVEDEKLLGWFPFVEEDFGGGCHAGLGGVREPEPAGFDDDIWRIHQIYEIPSYAAK